ncbi:amino acid ABC transporter permease [Leucobacter weissii]|uniref:Amino acid ABC transporter permease n=1 Tax=Leucobacter weissii TaxID=1983706 RepID=A0A939SAY6_9MICO|nr:amino acid ABC transporter permease [Leucobacter weissii]
MSPSEIFTSIAAGVPLTVLISVSAFAFGALLAVPGALALEARSRWLRYPVRAVVDLVRSVPILVWLFILYFGVSIGRFHFAPLPAAVLVLGIVAAAYLSEVCRTALAAVPDGQREAARSLGLGPIDRFRFVVAPQMVRVALPSAATFALTLLKDSSIPSVIGVTEIAYFTTQANRTAGAGLDAYLVAVLLYLVLSIPVAVAARGAERALRKRVRP